MTEGSDDWILNNSSVDAEQQFSQVGPANPKYDQIEEDIEKRHTHAEQAVKHHAKDALEELYSSDFPINDPPESFERYEAEMAVRHLRQSIKDMFTGPYKREFQMIVTTDGDGYDVVEVPKLEDAKDVFDGAWDLHVQQAKDRIDVMETYGDVAEPHIAALTYTDIHSEVRAYATKTLSEMRSDGTEAKSLTAAIRDWWKGGDRP